MDTFSIIRNALAASENDPNKVGLAQDVIDTGRIVAAVQVVVDALTPPDGSGRRYIVGFKDIQTAGTSLLDYTITVSSKPLRDPSLTIVEKAVVVATFAAHEIGHTFVSRPRKFPVNLIREHNDKSGYHSVSNIADDIILEPFMVDRYPILADAFAFTGMWVLRNTAKELPIEHTLNAGTKATERFNIMLSATRYGDIPEIVWADAKMIAERDYCRGWADRLIAARLTDHATFLALCDEMWEHVRTVDDEPAPEPEPEPEPEVEDEPEPEPEPEPEGDEDEPEPEPGECEPGPEGDPGPEVEDEPEPDGPGDEPDPDGEPEDAQGDDFDEEPEPEGPGGDEPVETEPTDEVDEDEDEDDFNTDEVDKSTHDQAEQTSYDGDLIERQVRTYASTTATVFGRHGRMTTTWD